MKHADYEKAIELDKKFAIEQRDYWVAKLNNAKENLERWQSQVEALSTVYGRVSIAQESPFRSSPSREIEG